MFNWYEIQVEQQIAQERYQVITRGRQPARSPQSKVNSESKLRSSARMRNWVGDQLINWGCQVKVSCQIV